MPLPLAWQVPPLFSMDFVSFPKAQPIAEAPLGGLPKPAPCRQSALLLLTLQPHARPAPTLAAGI